MTPEREGALPAFNQAAHSSVNIQNKGIMAHLPQPKKLSRPGRLVRSFLKRYLYSQLTIFSGLRIAFGRERPLIPFKIEADPPSVYWVFRIRPSEVENLAEQLGLPANFTLCPIKCLETDEPDFLLVVNAYRVSGLANGMRAEWSIFVRDEDGTPRYLILDARSSQRSMDPIHIITKASTVIHERDGNTIRTRIGAGDQAFRSTLTLSADLPVGNTSPDWVSANDTIYWANGISDRTFYNAGLADNPPLDIARANCVINDKSDWSQLVEPEPVHILVYNRGIELIISPWDNIERVHRQ
jgi:hypothetical protein